MSPDTFQSKVSYADPLTLFASEKVITADISGATSVHTADLDGDGDKDVLSASFWDNKIAWYENDGTGDFSVQRIVDSNVEGAHAVFAADLDGDGDKDVISGAWVTNEVEWYANDGGGNFGTGGIITTQGADPLSVLATDLDQDGDNDILYASYGGDRVSWHENNGSGGFSPQMVITSEVGEPWTVAAADLDGDGDQDVITASSYSTIYSDKVVWHENDGEGGFGPEQIITTQVYAPWSVAAADLDSDGDQDVLSGSFDENSSQEGKIAWYPNDGNGAFSTQSVIATNVDEPYSLWGQDLNGDGYRDVLSGSFNGDKVIWYKNNGGGSFGTETVITERRDPWAVEPADLDGDGDLDVVVGAAREITWYENRSEDGVGGPVAHYPFDGDASDASGNGNDGTVNGATLTTDRFGNAGSAYNFDGTNDYIEVADSDVFDFTEFTISFWAKPVGGNGAVITHGEEASSDNAQFGAGINQRPDESTGRFFVKTEDSSDRDYAARSSTIPQEGEWYFVTGRRRADGTIDLFINGVLESTAASSITTVDSPLWIGAGYSANRSTLTNFWSGKIDDVRVYDRPLTDVEIEELYGASFIAGQVVDSQTGEAIPGATVQAQQSTGSSQSSADGSYKLFVSPGTGYTVEVTAEGYFSSTRTYVDLEPAAPTLGVDFQLEPAIDASPIVTLLSPDPNPSTSFVGETGTAYRYYKVIDQETGRPLTGQRVMATGEDVGPFSAVSDASGVAAVPIPATAIGDAGASKTLSVTSVGGESIPEAEREPFDVGVVSRPFAKTWKLRTFGGLGAGVGLGGKLSIDGELANTGRTSLLGSTSLGDQGARVRLQRRRRGDIGLSVGVSAPLRLSFGDSGGFGAGASAGASLFAYREDGYEFSYQNPPTRRSAAARFYIWARSHMMELGSSNLFRMMDYLARNVLAESELADAYEYDAIGLGVRAFNSASIEAGIFDALPYDLGVKAGIGGEFESYLSTQITEGNSFEVAGRLRTESEAGVGVARPLLRVSSSWAGEGARYGERFRASLLESSVSFDQLGGQANVGTSENFGVGIGCDDANPGYLFLELGAEASGNLSNALGYDFPTEAESVSRIRRYDFDYASALNPAVEGPGANETLSEISGGCSLGTNLVFGRSTLTNLVTRLAGQAGLATARLEYPPVEYAVDSTLTQTGYGFEVEGGFTLKLDLSIGAGFTYVQEKTATVERGVWAAGRHYPRERYTSLPELEDRYQDVVTTLIRDLKPEWWDEAYSYAASFIPASSSKASSNTSSTEYQIGDNGTTISFGEGAIPVGVDSVRAASWGWWGASPSTMKYDIAPKARRIFSETKQAAETMQGMRYGIGGFYQVEPLGTPLEAATTITIHYADEELDGVAENELAVYSEDTQNGGWRYIGGTVDGESNTVTAPIDTLKTFTLAPRLPSGLFELTPDEGEIDADGSTTTWVRSGSLVNNDGSPVENGTLYTVEVDRGQVVSSDADTGRTGTQVAVQEGELAFEVQSDSVAGSSKVLARSVYGKATSEATITFQDTGAPAAVSIESAEAGDSRARLAWSPSSSPDVAGYKVYFGRDPDRLEGVAARGIQSPVDIGSSQQATLRGLVNDSTYHVAIAAYDVNGTESELSTLASVAPVDTVAPGPLSDLRPTMQADTTATLAWTAPGDNGNAGLAYAYEVRYTTAPVMDDTSAWWDEATPAAVNQPPSEAGASESVSIRGSFAGEVYYGVRTTDEVGNVSSVTITSTSELPVELTRFDASVKGQQVVLLQWETASEDGNAGFEVQRRMEDSSFERVGYVEGAGTTNSMRSYQFEDADIPFDVEAVTYRLRQVDLDGTFEYSPEVEVTLDAPEELAIHGNYPNPFHQRTKIRYELPRAGDVRIDVYNVLGQRVATLVNERQQAGREEITFDARRLASGVYFVRLRSLGESLTEKITVVR